MPPHPLAPSWLVEPDDANALDAAVWSSHAARDEHGALTIAGVAASDLVARYGTPVYVVDERDVRERAARVRDVFARELARVGSSVKVYYAGKAFLSTQVVGWMRDADLSIDVCSGGELAVALAGGADPARLGLHGNNKSLAEIERAVEVGVGAIVVDSEIEVQRVADAAARAQRVQPVRLRVTTGVHAHTHEYLATAREDQKFGIPLADVERVVADIRSHDSLRLLGLHSHIGSQITGAEGFAEAARRLVAVHARLLADGPVPELNVGGGFGIAYTSAEEPADLEAIAAGIADAVADACDEHGVPVPVVAIEPGRAIIGPSTTTLYTVGTIKPVELATDGGLATRTYVSVDGGMSDNVRPALYGADYTARIASRVSDAAPALVRVAGKHCESGDIVVRDEYLPEDVAPGDILAVPATGAYCWALASNYNWLGRPPVVAVRDGESRVIVRGETIDDLLSRDVAIGAP